MGCKIIMRDFDICLVWFIHKPEVPLPNIIGCAKDQGAEGHINLSKAVSSTANDFMDTQMALTEEGHGEEQQPKVEGEEAYH